MATRNNTPPAEKPETEPESAAVQAAQATVQNEAETATAPAAETAATVQNEAETATAPAAETAAANPGPDKPAPPKAAKKGTAGWVMATLKTRHCDGGVCKEAGEEMRMTRGTYERLKKYGRVE